MIGMAAAEGAPSLVELDLRFNELAEKTKKAVRSAINARNATIARGIKVWASVTRVMYSQLSTVCVAHARVQRCCE